MISIGQAFGTRISSAPLSIKSLALSGNSRSNYPEAVPDCNGGSSVFDGVAYLPELDGSRDMCILQADEKEGIYVAELDLDKLRLCHVRHLP